MIGAEIKEIRSKLNLTQNQFAAELGISRVFLGLLERDERTLSEDVAYKIAEIINRIPDEKNGWEKYKIGRNFAKIIETLRERGHSLSQLKDEDFRLPGTDMSYMYIGLKPIPLEVKDKLESKYNINIEYLFNGKKVPMFLQGELNNMDVPYYKGYTFKDALQKFEDLDFNGSQIINWEKNDIVAFVELQGDNKPINLIGNEILGLSKTGVSIETYGRLFLIKFLSGDVILRRILPSNNSHQIILKKEDPSFLQLTINISDIHTIYLVKSIYCPDYI